MLGGAIGRWTVSRVIDAVASAAGNMSDANIHRIVRMFGRLNPDAWYAGALKKIEQAVADRHMGVEAARRIARNLSPKVRRTIVRNYIVGTLIEGNKVRRKFWEEEGFNAPPMVMISVTSVCNYKCYGCYADGEDWKSDLPIDVIHRVIDEASSIGSRFIAITGGEPFLRRDLMSIFEKHPEVMFSVYTNGSRITPAMLDRFADWGNVQLNFSVEGPRAHTDDRRGDGAWDVVMHQMAECRKRGLYFGFGTTVSRKTMEAALSDDFIRSMIDAGTGHGWYLNLMPTGPVESRELMLTAQQRYWMRERASVIRRTHPIYLVDFVNESWLVGGCMAGGRKMIHINSKGDVEPCMFIHYAVDNIRTRSIREVLRSDFFRKMRDAVPHDARDARPCPIIDHPHKLREAVAETGAYETTADAHQLLEDWAPVLDGYAAEFARLDEKHAANPADAELAAIRATVPQEIPVGVEVGKRYGPPRETARGCGCGSAARPAVVSSPEAPRS